MFNNRYNFSQTLMLILVSSLVVIGVKSCFSPSFTRTNVPLSATKRLCTHCLECKRVGWLKATIEMTFPKKNGTKNRIAWIQGSSALGEIGVLNGRYTFSGVICMSILESSENTTSFACSSQKFESDMHSDVAWTGMRYWRVADCKVKSCYATSQRRHAACIKYDIAQ